MPIRHGTVTALLAALLVVALFVRRSVRSPATLSAPTESAEERLVRRTSHFADAVEEGDLQWRDVFEPLGFTALLKADDLPRRNAFQDHGGGDIVVREMIAKKIAKGLFYIFWNSLLVP